MKRLLLSMMFVVFAISMLAYAVEFSIGGSLGGGIPFLRGNDAKEFNSLLETVSGDSSPDRGLFFYQADLMLEIIPYFAIETGVGYILPSMTYDNQRLITLDAQRLYIPLMIRGQYEWQRHTLYGSVGVKLGVPMGRPYLSGIYIQPIITPSIEKSDFTMDVSFAIGGEYRIGDANYLGIRIGYDLNVIQGFNKSQFERLVPNNPINNFVDDVTIALTYRYAFNSKWKK